MRFRRPADRPDLRCGLRPRRVCNPSLRSGQQREIHHANCPNQALTLDPKDFRSRFCHPKTLPPQGLPQLPSGFLIQRQGLRVKNDAVHLPRRLERDGLPVEIRHDPMRVPVQGVAEPAA